MKRDIEIWQMARDYLSRDESIMLLVVAESTGSSPGRAGYKMIVAANGDLAGSIGGGMMEVNLVEQSRSVLSEPGAIATGFPPGAQCFRNDLLRTADCYLPNADARGPSAYR
jgi:xanthine/CO dehydrogenase XdhC/CoxF family maturation factor